MFNFFIVCFNPMIKVNLKGKVTTCKGVGFYTLQAVKLYQSINLSIIVINKPTN